MVYSVQHYLRLICGPEPLRKVRPGLCLEVGSGAFPLWCADVLSDRYVVDRSHRSHRPLLVDQRPMVICSAMNLPFKDHAFDFVVCRHVLEHLPEPQRALAEIVRVGKGGYIEGPSPVSESLFGWPKHRWLVWVEGDTLHLAPKGESPFGTLFHDLYQTDKRFAAFYDARPDVFLTRYLWRQSMGWVVHVEDKMDTSRTNEGELAEPLPEENLSHFPLQHRIWHKLTWLLRTIRGRRVPRDIVHLLRCPRCRGELRPGSGELACTACGARYPCKPGRYVLLPPGEGG